MGNSFVEDDGLKCRPAPILQCVLVIVEIGMVSCAGCHGSGSSVGIVNLLDSGATVKAFCSYHIHRQFHFLQTGAVCKGIGTKGGYAVIQHRFFQIDAIPECVLTYIGHGITDMKAEDLVTEVIPGCKGGVVIIVHIAGTGNFQQTAGIEGPFCVFAAVAGGNDGSCQSLIRLDLQFFRIPDGLVIVLVGG